MTTYIVETATVGAVTGKVIYAGPEKDISKDLMAIAKLHLESDFPMITPGDLREGVHDQFIRTKFVNGLPVKQQMTVYVHGHKQHWVECWNNKIGDAVYMGIATTGTFNV